jgi:hypothetical protein
LGRGLCWAEKNGENMKSSPGQITTHNPGWHAQFCLAGHVFGSGVCEFRW